MDLSVKLVLRAQAEGTSAIKAMREETSELASAMKEVREAARSGGQVSPQTIKALGGYNEFQEAFAKAQKELAAPVKEAATADPEKRFRAQLQRTNSMAKVRAAESARVEREQTADVARQERERRRQASETDSLRRKLFLDEVRAAKAATAEIDAAVARGEANQRRAMEQTLQYNMRMWAQRGRAAERAEAEETAAHGRLMRRFGLGMFAGGAGREAHGGGHRGRGILGELGTAAEYTLTYGAINKVLEGVGAIASSPISIGKMTLDVAQHAREVKELASATRLTTGEVQQLQYAFSAKGLDADKLPQTLLFLARSEVGAARGIKNNAVAFRALGVSVFDANHHLRPLKDLLYDTTDALHRQTSAAKADAISQMIFGRGVKDILPIIQGGSKALRDMASEANKSGYVITAEDLERGEQLAGQWSRLKLQLAGVRNTAAVAAMPIVSDLLGEASSYLTSHRAEVTKSIRDNFAELKSDLPVIVSGMKALADDTLAMSRGIGPFVTDLIRLGNSPIAKYLFSGEIVPGGVDLGKPGGGPGVEKPAQLYNPEAHSPIATTPPPRVDVHVHAAPGVAVGQARARGADLNVHRGSVGVGG